EIIPNETGLVCEPRNTDALASMVADYANSALFKELQERRPAIASGARERHSWSRVAEITRGVYEQIADGWEAGHRGTKRSRVESS
ncbi:MAG: hypothetical protein RLN69_08670, partial [Woeseiaceae bacterium]